MLAWILITAWTALIIYVFIDVRRVMRFNSRANEKLGLGLPTRITERSVLINRILLIVLLVITDVVLARLLF